MRIGKIKERTICPVIEITENGLQNSLTNEYYEQPGVWMLIGKERNSNHFICLQVAKTVDIGKEIERDNCYLVLDIPKPIPTNYVNQFGEKQFEYKNFDDWTAKFLYHFIATSYEELHFVCVAHGKQYKDNSLRKLLEKYVAYKTLSKYWRNGGSFNPKEQYYIKERKKACINECKIIREQLYNKVDFFEKIDKLLEKIASDKLVKIEMINTTKIE